METINDNIRLLLEMLDNPDAYTEQEILSSLGSLQGIRE